MESQRKRRTCGWESPPKQKLKNDDDDELQEASDDDDDLNDEEEIKLKQEASYQRYLRLFQPQVGPEMDKDLALRICPICETQRFKGWGPLRAHATKITSKKKHAHRGLARALDELWMAKPRETVEPISSRAAQQNRADIYVVWPPLLLLRGCDSVVDGLQRAGLQYLVAGGAVDERKVAKVGRDLVVRLQPCAMAHNLIQAKKVVDAAAAETFDPERSLEWSILPEAEVRKRLQAMTKEEEELNARRYNLTLRSVASEEHVEQILSEKQFFQKQSSDLKEQQARRQAEIQAQQEQYARKTAETERRLKDELRNVQINTDKEYGRLKRQLELNEAKSEKELLELRLHNRHLQDVLRNGTRHARMLTQRRLQLEKQHQEVLPELKKKEEAMQQSLEEEEKALCQKHSAEIEDLEILLGKELEETVVAQGPGPTAPAAKECCVCLCEIEERGIFSCGHANVCYCCASAVFDSRKRCPVCRTWLEYAPVKTRINKVF